MHHIGDLYHAMGEYHEPNAFNQWHEGEWEHLSSEYIKGTILCLAMGLYRLGLRKGDRVGIMALPSGHWTMADLAVMLVGGVSVPFFNTLSKENFCFEVEQCKPRFMFVGDLEHWALLESTAHHFEKTISIEKGSDEKVDLTLQELIHLGQEANRESPQTFPLLIQALQEEDLATIIYTSGRGGLPRGVEMTHRALTHLIQFDDFKWNHKTDRYLGILPLAHIFGRQLNLIMVGWGVPIYYLNDLTKLREVCQEVHPTIMIVVPRVLEKISGKLESMLKNAPFFIRTLGLWAMHQGQKEESFIKRCLRPFADLILYRKMRQFFGERMRMMFCGGAALDPSLNRLFLSAGIPLVEGWGLSEASTVCVNLVGEQKVGTVGPVLNELEIKISPEGRVLVRGAAVMRGYYQMPEETKEALDSEGWLHTGDRGEIDQNGYLKLLGRINDLFKTSGGEYVSPAPLERELVQHTLIDMALIVGEKRPFIVALLFPDRSEVKQMKKRLGFEAMSDEAFLETPEVRGEVTKWIDEINKKVNAWANIRDFAFVGAPLTIEGGDLTPTMEIQRRHVQEKYEDLISKLYREGKS